MIVHNEFRWPRLLVCALPRNIDRSGCSARRFATTIPEETMSSPAAAAERKTVQRGHTATMTAAVLPGVGEQLQVGKVAVPSIGSRDVLLQVEACGVCHTDLHVAEGLFRAFGMDTFPLIPGHEAVGRVAQVGADVTHLKEGDRVGMYFCFSCGLCRNCLTGWETACATLLTNPQLAGISVDGGYAEYVRVPAEHLVRIPEQLDFVDAAPFFCSGLTMYGGFKAAGLQPHQRVAVLGIGGLGHLAVPIAKAMGAEVVAITSNGKEQAARDLGADEVITRNGDVGQQLLALGGADVILTTTIDGGDITSVMQGLRPLGSYVITGMTTDPLPITPAAFALMQQRVIGSIIGTRADLEELLALAVRHQIRPTTEVYKLEQVNTVHDRLRKQQVRLRAVLTPN